MANLADEANMAIGARMERIRGREQAEAEGAARELIERENGQFYIDNQPMEQFMLSDVQGVNDQRNTIGKGGFTDAVKQCIYAPRKLPIAVKIIHIIDLPSGKNKGKGEVEIAREADNTKRSAHENVVWLHGFIVQEMTCYLCMELMQANVDEVKKVAHDQAGLNIGSKFTKEDIEKFLGCVTVAEVDGLAYLRIQKVIHRDIKPNNIMINDQGQVKICDFGVSKKLQTGISSSRAHTTGAGCISYMAPEQLSVDARTVGYGSKSGVWSLGISLHECSTGKHAFAECCQMDIAEHICTKDPPRIPSQSGCSSNLRNFVDACLFKHEPDRASIVPTDSNCLQKKKFYIHHFGRGTEDRKNNVIDVLKMVTPHIPTLRRDLNR